MPSFNPHYEHKQYWYGAIEYLSLEQRWIDLQTTKTVLEEEDAGQLVEDLWTKLVADMEREDFLDHTGHYRLAVFGRDKLEDDGNLHNVLARYSVKRVLKIELIK